MSITVSEFTTYYWYCPDCQESEDYESEGIAEAEGAKHVCDG